MLYNQPQRRFAFRKELHKKSSRSNNYETKKKNAVVIFQRPILLSVPRAHEGCHILTSTHLGAGRSSASWHPPTEDQPQPESSKSSRINQRRRPHTALAVLHVWRRVRTRQSLLISRCQTINGKTRCPTTPEMNST